ncbi:MAG: sulfotransferase [Gammaproteobacteria bacterium]|nr:sulfotransferase [Gammaproteobacteria bacterium]
MTPRHLRPSFFIVGVNKCGTSSLYRYLVDHPAVLPCAEKEPNFFGTHTPDYIAGHIDEYFALFPTDEYGGPLTFEWEASDRAGGPRLTTVCVDRAPHGGYITGEATASTFHEVSPSLLHRYLPETKLIVLVRNPVDRAYSHHLRSRGKRVGLRRRRFSKGHRGGVECARARRVDSLPLSRSLRRSTAGVARRVWREPGPDDRHRDLGQPPVARDTMRQLETYLGLPSHDYAEILARRFNHAPPADITPSLRASLAAFYHPYNVRLQECLGRDLHWD